MKTRVYDGYVSRHLNGRISEPVAGLVSHRQSDEKDGGSMTSFVTESPTMLVRETIGGAVYNSQCHG